MALATLALCAVVALAFLLERLAGAALAHQGGEAPTWALAIADTAAEARLNQDSALFEPWQPWTHVLVQQGWWQLVAGILGVMAAGVVIEGELGGPALMIASLAVLPLAAAGGVLGGGDPGIASLVIGLMLVALGRAPRTTSRWGVSYYAITEVGHVHLFTAPLWLLGAAYLAQEAVRCRVQHVQMPLLAWFGALVAGAAVGVASRRLLPPAAGSPQRPA